MPPGGRHGLDYHDDHDDFALCLRERTNICAVPQTTNGGSGSSIESRSQEPVTSSFWVKMVIASQGLKTTHVIPSKGSHHTPHGHGCPFWLIWSNNRGRFLFFLVVQSTTRAIYVPPKRTPMHMGSFCRKPTYSVW